MSLEQHIKDIRTNCHPPSKPIAFIEVKQMGQSDGAERQLFEYAFHLGVPLAILTDGQEWNFFLPGEQGNYGERRVYKLDIVERDIMECTARLNRYLLYDAILSGKAIENAREDYRNVSRDRQMLVALPKAWIKLVEDEDELLLELVADRVENLCGFKPEELYPNRPDLVLKASRQLNSGWWLGIYVRRVSIEKIIQMACEVAGIKFGKDLKINLGE